jgi:hypothetical protein
MRVAKPLILALERAAAGLRQQELADDELAE